MKRDIKVITINGFRGLVLAAFIIFGLVSGFIVAPAYFCKEIWNFIGTNYVVLPHMEIYHGAILWAIIALSVYAICKNKIYIGVPVAPKFDEEKLKAILKAHADSSLVSPFIEKPNFKEEENKKEEIKK